MIGSGGVAFGDVEVGTELPAQTFHISRATLVRYAGASGDFNAIHWNERVAKDVGLPGVIAQGMLTMAHSLRVVTDWLGDPGAVTHYGVRFTRPVVVADNAEGATLQVSGVVKQLRTEDRSAVISLTTTVEGQTVLAKARAVVRLC